MSCKPSLQTLALILLTALVCLAFVRPPLVQASSDEQDDQCGSNCNRVYKISLEIGDPVMAASGALRFNMPLLYLGGPMNLHFSVMYGSDYVNWVKNDLGFGNAGQSRFWWSPGCAAYMSDTLYQFWLDDFRQVAFDPTTREINETNEPQSVRYQLEMTDDHAFVMDPIRELVYVFDKTDEMIREVQDRNGNTLSYTYDGNDRLDSISDGLGRELNFTYTEIGTSFVITRVTDQSGREIDFSYEEAGADNNGRGTLRSITDALDQTTTFAYTPTNFITSVTYPEENTPYTQEWEEKAIYENSFATRVTKQTDAYNHETTLDYDNTTDQVTETTPENNDIVYEHFNHHAPPKGLIDAAGNPLTLTRNARNQVTSMTDRTGGVTAVTYHDPTGKLATMTNADNKVLSFTYTAQTQTFTDPDHPDNTVDFTFYNLTKINYPDGTSETFTYDAKGNVLTSTDRASKTWTYTYNGEGQILTATNPEGGVTTATYNADVTLATLTDADTGATAYAYDGYKRLIRITRPGDAFVQITYDLNNQVTSTTDERGKKYDYAYDANGNLASITDPDTKQNLFSHNLMDRLAEATNARGKQSQYTYDSMNRLQSVTDPGGSTVQFGYNSRGWLDTLTDPAGHAWTTAFDNEGLPLTHTTPLGRTTTFTRDALGRVTKIKDPMDQETVFTRDAMSRITKVTDPLNRQTTYAYDVAGRLTGVTLPNNTSAAYRRNSLGLVDRITDLNGSQWNLGYTLMGRLASLTDPLNNQWQYDYDTQGRLSQVTYPDASTLTRTIDDAGNLLRSQYSAGPDLKLDLAFTYDDQNRLLTAEHIAFTYNETGQVTATTDEGITFGATYDNAGRLATATYNNDQFSVTYTYDARGLLTKVTDSITGAIVDFSHDNDGRLTTINRSSGVGTTYTRDPASRITRIQHQTQHATLADLRYTLNAAGEVTVLDYDLPLDPADYLAMATDDLTHDAASQITTAGYTYDAQGRQTAAPGHTFTWDGASRLIATEDATLTYNGLSDLRTRQSSGATIHYHYNHALDLHSMVAEYNVTAGAWKRFYVLAPGGTLLYAIDPTIDLAVAPSAEAAVSFYHFDSTGNTLFLTDGGGSVTDTYAYSPYGRLLAHDGFSDQPFTFVGAWQVRQDGDAGLYQMRVRYYDARTAAFLSREPLWPIPNSPMDLNPYQYALNNPLEFIDVTGLFSVFGDAHGTMGEHLAYERLFYDAVSDSFDEDARNAFLEQQLDAWDRLSFEERMAALEVIQQGKMEFADQPGFKWNDKERVRRFLNDMIKKQLELRKAGKRPDILKAGLNARPEEAKGGKVVENKPNAEHKNEFVSNPETKSVKPVAFSPVGVVKPQDRAVAAAKEHISLGTLVQKIYNNFLFYCLY